MPRPSPGVGQVVAADRALQHGGLATPGQCVRQYVLSCNLTKVKSSMAGSPQSRISPYCYVKYQLRICGIGIEVVQWQLLVAVDHSQLHIMASDTVDPVEFLLPLSLTCTAQMRTTNQCLGWESTEAPGTSFNYCSDSTNLVPVVQVVQILYLD